MRQPDPSSRSIISWVDTGKTQSSANTLTELEMICVSQNAQLSIHDDSDELTKYLETSTYLYLLV